MSENRNDPSRGAAVKRPSSDVAFSAAVKRVQSERGSRRAYERLERAGGFAREVTDDLRAFLSRISTAFLATASADGQPYVQHRGGRPGFIRAVDEATLAFVELAGNRQYVTTGNLLENDRVCLLLMDYERRQRVKVWGAARLLAATDALRARFADSAAEHIMVITVTAWDANCPRHIPQLVCAHEHDEEVATLRARIAQLEAQLRDVRSA